MQDTGHFPPSRIHTTQNSLTTFHRESNSIYRFDLNADDVNKFLPMIDTSKTLIRNVCPSCLSRVACKAGKYRRPDGLCNNIAHPNWGSTMSTFNRLMAPRYSDKVSAPKVAASGDPLPLARVVSKTVHPDDGRHEHAGTVMLVAWGQFMDHDLTLTATPLGKY